MKVLPHVIDTILLASAIGLVLVTKQYPGYEMWLNAKIVALLLYIVLGLIAFRFARNRGQIAVAWILGQLMVTYIILVALTRSVYVVDASIVGSNAALV